MTASRFGFSMMTAGAACTIHAFIPILLDRSASSTVRRLHHQMKNRNLSSNASNSSPTGIPLLRQAAFGDPTISAGGTVTASTVLRAPAPHLGAAVLLPGIMLAFAGAAAAMAIAGKTIVPATFAALLLGLAMSQFPLVRKRCEPGFMFSGRTLLRLGVVLLGAKIDAATLYGIGLSAGLVTLIAMSITIAAGTVVGRMLGFSRELSLLSSCAVAICGASAALAIAAVLPKSDRSDDGDTAYVIGAVTLLGSAVMILLPLVAHMAGYNAHFTAVLLGGAIHELAQVAGAGFGLSDAIGTEATAVKLLRVACLAPIAGVVGYCLRGKSSASPPIMPGFLIGFLALAAATTLGLVSGPWKADCASVSSLCLLAALVAIGAQLSFRSLAKRGPGPALLIAGQSLILITALMTGLHLISNPATTFETRAKTTFFQR